MWRKPQGKSKYLRIDGTRQSTFTAAIFSSITQMFPPHQATKRTLLIFIFILLPKNPTTINHYKKARSKRVKRQKRIETIHRGVFDLKTWPKRQKKNLRYLKN